MKTNPIIVSNKYDASALRAKYNHIWTLSPEDRNQLGMYVLVKTTVKELLNKIDTSHAYIDFLTFKHQGNRVTCRVNFVNGSVSYLEELEKQGKKNEICLVSFRMARVQFPVSVDYETETYGYENTNVALVLISPQNIQVSELKCYDLNGKEIG